MTMNKQSSLNTNKQLLEALTPRQNSLQKSLNVQQGNPGPRPVRPHNMVAAPHPTPAPKPATPSTPAPAAPSGRPE